MRFVRVNSLAFAGLAVALMLGTLMRLIWPADMEYKADEIYSFDRSQLVGATEAWPWVGMSNSADVPHPGMSVWVFVWLARLTNSGSPVALNVACMCINVAALLALVAFIACTVPSDEREVWWWAAALVAVNPLAVLFHRKIWPPSLLPLISVLLLVGWWHRHQRRWALFWGATSLLAAQIHPGAFFFSAGMALWAACFDRASVRWLWLAAGALVAALPAIPWIHHLAFAAEHSAASKTHWWRMFELRFWRYWLTEPFGLGINYSLGQDFPNFLRYPIVMNHATYLVAALHLVLVFVLLVVTIRWIIHRLNGPRLAPTRTGFTVAAVAFGYGGLLTCSGLPVYRHYMIITFPIMFVGLVQAAFAGFTLHQARRVLAALGVAQACVSGLFLWYIHGLDRPVRGDYGTPYRVQLAHGSAVVTAGVSP